MLKKLGLAAGLVVMGFLAAPDVATTQAEAKLFCSDTGKRFNEWKKAFAKQYGSQYKKKTMAKFMKVKYNTRVIKSDRNNKAKFKGTFESFYKRRSKGVAPIAVKKHKQYKRYFDRAEKEFGVPRELILAIWGLETAFGRYSGKEPILESTATLAYDCRRSASLFFPELLAALKIIDRGYADLSVARGAVHGEIGQTQFLSTRFLMSATDYDGKGVNVFKSPADVIGSTAKWFKVNGWRSGGDYSPGTANFRVIMKWNRADNYQLTIPRLAKAIKRKL